ncbi:SPRY domain-containing protein [Lysinibacillus fusiformis]|uniref:F5/8 type C domain-containing protein n=1 Tax=Lysinibacillus fusiformis TaxID=28031 RepID=A0A1H9MYG3_9BACI|nr:SPRY domain-containing protein [Lysinibacillus fusiformis]SCY65354.1 F5/8 type C domain-containing protein [Lysinibacillus fusiformis]SEO05190.1 F5/8 type C domain-containing protein [Lysinibacillus fusiformis]SER28712.1 F5/8 type C domain-containing protein [Lysinibacillus fusiformis]
MVVAWNPTDKGSTVGLLTGNLSATGILQTRNVKSTDPKTNGRWYCEIKMDGANFTLVGIAPSNANMNANIASTTGFCCYYANGNKIIEGANTAYGASYTTSDIIGIFVDFEDKQITFYKNGISQGVAWSGFSHMNDFVIVTTSGTISNNTNVTANFGAKPFLYAPVESSLPSNVFSYDGSQQLSRVDKSLVQDGEGYKAYVKGKEHMPSVNLIPVMTSDTAPAPYASSASSSYGGYTAFNAFNRVFNGTSRWIANTVPPVWCKISLDAPKKAFSYQLATGEFSQAITSWILQGSNDNNAWTDLDTVTNHTLPIESYEEFKINVPNEYQHYRIYATATLNNGLASLSGFTLLTEDVPATPDMWKTVSTVTPTQQRFKDDGMDSLNVLNRKVTTLAPKAMLDKSETLLGEEGQVFAYSIDLKKYLDIRSIRVEVK